MSLTWAIRWEEPPSLKPIAAIASSCHSFIRPIAPATLLFKATATISPWESSGNREATGLCWWATSCKPLRFRCSFAGAQQRSAMLVLLYALGRKTNKNGRFYPSPIWVTPPKKQGFGCQRWMIMVDDSKLAMLIVCYPLIILQNTILRVFLRAHHATTSITLCRNITEL